MHRWMKRERHDMKEFMMLERINEIVGSWEKSETFTVEVKVLTQQLHLQFCLILNMKPHLWSQWPLQLLTRGSTAHVHILKWKFDLMLNRIITMPVTLSAVTWYALGKIALLVRTHFGCTEVTEGPHFKWSSSQHIYINRVMFFNLFIRINSTSWRVLTARTNIKNRHIKKHYRNIFPERKIA